MKKILKQVHELYKQIDALKSEKEEIAVKLAKANFDKLESDKLIVSAHDYIKEMDEKIQKIQVKPIVKDKEDSEEFDFWTYLLELGWYRINKPFLSFKHEKTGFEIASCIDNAGEIQLLWRDSVTNFKGCLIPDTKQEADTLLKLFKLI